MQQSKLEKLKIQINKWTILFAGDGRFPVSNSWNSHVDVDIIPTEGQEYWEPTDYIRPIPASIRKRPRRPKKARRKDVHEEGTSSRRTKIKRACQTMNCLRCGLEGHNMNRYSGQGVDDMQCNLVFICERCLLAVASGSAREASHEDCSLTRREVWRAIDLCDEINKEILETNTAVKAVFLLLQQLNLNHANRMVVILEYLEAQADATVAISPHEANNKYRDSSGGEQCGNIEFTASAIATPTMREA
ncbi:hypothetical protein MTR_7g019190 [Medicago truncatula]|uniref:Uncharacterized protein n=1 Tax=Medicago truncatula TaxID=3880 RepID=A0A072TWQ8_MEDTR|nr:hypothetical protein MTR_7g019190 [Medicago truncatula]